MPVATFVLDELNRTVFEKSYAQITQEVISALNVPYDYLTIYYKDHDIARTDNSTTISPTKEENIPLTVGKKRLQVKINEEFNEDELATTTTTQLNSYPIFVDEESSIYIYPIYVKTNLEFEFSFITTSKVEANKIRDLIRIKLSQLRNILIHDIEYSYLIPDAIEEFIGDIYDLKKRFINISLEDYFLSHSTKRIHLVSDLTHKESALLAVYEKQIRIVGEFDFILPEKLEIEMEDGNYKINFTYKLAVDYPRAIVINYPIVVANQVIPYKYLSFLIDSKTHSKEELDHHINYLTYSNYVLSLFEIHRWLENRIDIRLPRNIPYIDDFKVRVGMKGYAITTSFLTTIDESDGVTLMNLANINKDYYIHPAILDFISKEIRTKITIPYATYLYLGLHQEGRYFDADHLVVEEDFTIKSITKLDLMKPTRITLSIIIDPTFLMETKHCLMMTLYPEAFFIILNEMVFAIKNYRAEFAQLNIPDNTFYRFFIQLLYCAYQSEDAIAACSILTALAQDGYLYANFISILYNNYPTLFNFIKNNCRVYLDTVDLLKNKDYTGIEMYVMKTVMQAYVIAFRIGDLDANRQR